MEFRGILKSDLLPGTRVIIDPHWNLEVAFLLSYSTVKVVIIDPHWNLEENVSEEDRMLEEVIIDPHWNLEP